MKIKLKVKMDFTWSKIKEMNGENLFNELEMKFHKMERFMMKLRSTFFCSLCDFQNHRFFDFKKKVFTMNYSSC